MGRTLLFTANDETHLRELGKSDGTKAGMFLAKGINAHHVQGRRCTW